MDTNVLQTLKTFIEVAEIYAFGSREIREAATLLLDRQAILRLSPGTLNPTKPFHRLPDEIQTRKADDPLTREVKNAAGIVGFLRTGKRTAQGIRYATENRVEQSNLTDEEIKTVMVERLRRIVGIIERYLRAPGEEEEQVGEAQISNDDETKELEWDSEKKQGKCRGNYFFLTDEPEAALWFQLLLDAGNYITFSEFASRFEPKVNVTRLNLKLKKLVAKDIIETHPTRVKGQRINPRYKLN